MYDPELHWCRPCQAFPKTAKDYLIHLHTKEHAEKSSKPPVAPWREAFQKTNNVPSYPDAPTKRAPIRGLQFFEPATAWFCKLCEVFMGDVGCTSLHLKSEIHADKYAVSSINDRVDPLCSFLEFFQQKFIEKEPKFEEKWLEARKKAFELSESNGLPSLDIEKRSKDEKKAKKKKNKRDSRKDKKKRSRAGKKRKRGSSSSSSDSDDSDSSSGSTHSSKKNESDAADTKNSIRVQMRNAMAKSNPTENDERTGKWTMVSANSGKPVPPPAPSISQNTIQEKKKDDQILGQWSHVVEPIISQEEKSLLEKLKGRLKSQQKPEEKKVEEKVRERSRERERERSRGGRSRERERSRGDRYRGRRSRSRSRSRSRGRYRRYSRSRSGSRGRRRIERPIVNFPTEPRLPPSRDDKKLPARSYVISKKEDSSSNSKKVMPMIGKMPVFKKQLSDKKSEELVEEKVDEAPAVEAAEEKKPRDDTWDDYMPDPLQYSALMGAPPPPPRIEEPEVVPPGLDPDFDSEFIPKPISDAPIARKGPLPKDFQDTLDLLYDGDTPKPLVIEQKPAPEVVPIEAPPMVADPDGPQMIMAEDLSQHALLYGGFYADDSPAQPTEDVKAADGDSKDLHSNEDANGSVEMIEADEASKEQQIEMDDLAMLGIDVNDVGSGVW